MSTECSLSKKAGYRRWLQFSVRSLLLVILVASAYFAGIASNIDQVRRLERDLEEERRVRIEAEALIRPHIADFDQDGDLDVFLPHPVPVVQEYQSE
jgi:hypothetical protein